MAHGLPLPVTQPQRQCGSADEPSKSDASAGNLVSTRMNSEIGLVAVPPPPEQAPPQNKLLGTESPKLTRCMNHWEGNASARGSSAASQSGRITSKTTAFAASQSCSLTVSFSTSSCHEFVAMTEQQSLRNTFMTCCPVGECPMSTQQAGCWNTFLFLTTSFGLASSQSKHS